MKIGWVPSDIYTFVDSETDDIEEYQRVAEETGSNVVIFDMEEARRRYDYVHRPSQSRRSAGQARNMFQDWAIENGIDFYVVLDDDTSGFQRKRFGMYKGIPSDLNIIETFNAVEVFMRKRKIGLFGLSQTGDMFGYHNKIFRHKVMNTTFYYVPYIYRGERGVQDDDTSMFVGIMNEGLFSGSCADGLVLNQTASATQAGGLTDLYNECKLLNKALVTVIQFPSAIIAERQVMNGGRIHHRIANRYLEPRIIRSLNGRDNIAWDTYEEDFPFTNEPNRKYLQDNDTI